MVQKRSAPKGQSQISRFKSLARDLECDERETPFDQALGKISQARESRPVARKRKLTPRQRP
jgi:hypothetical protein